MNNLDVSGILHTYAEKSRNAQTADKLKEIIVELRSELDLRKVRMENAKQKAD